MNTILVLWYFIIYSVTGWIMETIYVSLQEQKYINRGFLHGCYCPIYGFGMCTIIVILLPYKNSPFAVFFGGIILSTVLEYFTGWIMEKLFNTRWWDYSEYKLNLNGRICMTRSIEWGFLSLFMIQLIHPFVEKMVDAIPYRTGIVLLYIVLIIDFVYSVIRASKLSGKIRSLDFIKHELQLLINTSELPEKINGLILKHNHIINNIERREIRFLNAFPNIIKSKINKLNEIKEDFYEKFK